MSVGKKKRRERKNGEKIFLDANLKNSRSTQRKFFKFAFKKDFSAFFEL